MPCYRPNMMLFDTKKTPKQKIKFVSANSKDFVGYEYFDEENKFLKSPRNVYHKGEEWIRVPCGQCIGCQEAYSKQWAVRCMLEASQFDSSTNFFLTLTYDDANLPRGVEIVNKDTGEIKVVDGCLVKKHIQDFIKRLRFHFQDKYHHTGIRVFYCGEYGGQTGRCHFHCILFNCPIPQDNLKIFKVTKENNIIWTCDEIEKLWNKGFISLAEVNWDTCAYTARYCLKKVRGKISQDYYFEQGKTPEFTGMSLRPAIGSNFFDQHFQEIYENDEMIIKGHKEKIQPIKPPKYYDKKFQAMFPDRYDALVVKRKQTMCNKNKLKLNNTTLTEREQLRVEEEEKKNQMKLFRMQRDRNQLTK